MAELFGVDMDKSEGFHLRNASLFVLPLLTGYFVWRRRRCTCRSRSGWGPSCFFWRRLLASGGQRGYADRS